VYEQLTLNGILPVSGVYMIENTRCGKKYVGSSKNIKNRIRDHVRNLNNGKHHSAKLQRAYDGVKDKSVFVASILEEVNDIDQLFEREQYFIDFYDAYGGGYNCASKADNPYYSKKNITKAQKKKAIAEIYKQFDLLYDFNVHHFGFKVSCNIASHYYKQQSIGSIVAVMKWFNDNYNREKHKIRFRWYFDMLCPAVLDDNNRPFAVYVYHKGQIYVSETDTTILLKRLAENNQFEKSVHYAIKTVETFDWESFIDKRHGDSSYKLLKSNIGVEKGIPILYDSVTTDKYRNFTARETE
jgi:group I intron endonuclease